MPLAVVRRRSPAPDEPARAAARPRGPNLRPFRTDNASFTDDGEISSYARDREIARILRHVAKRLEDGPGSYDVSTIIDANGNTVGKWEIK